MRQHRFDARCFRAAALAALALATMSAVVPTAAAQSVLVDVPEAAVVRVSLMAEGRSRKDLLAELLRDTGATIQFRDPTAAMTPIPGVLEGDVETLAARLLRGTNHALQFRDTPDGRVISRVVVYGAAIQPPSVQSRYGIQDMGRRNAYTLFDPTVWQMKGAQEDLPAGS